MEVTRPDHSDRSLSCSCARTMKLPPQALFPAWTSDEFGRWFGNSAETLLMKPEVNVPWYFEARFEGQRHPHYGRFLRLEPDRLIETTWLNEAATKGAETIVTIELVPSGEGTLLKLSHSGFADEESRNGHEQAWPQVLEHLDNNYSPPA